MEPGFFQHRAVRPRRSLHVLVTAGLLLGTSPLAWTDGPKPEKPGKAKGSDHRPGDLTPEERQRLDEVLAQAWRDASVVEAREQVHAATDNYRKALRDAVERIDPSAVHLLGKLHDKSRVEAMRRKFPFEGPPGMGPPLPEDPAASIQALATQEANFRRLEGPDRDRFLALAQQLNESKALEPQIRKAFEAWTRGGRDAGKSRRELREQFLVEMKKLDPWAENLLSAPKDPSPPSTSPAPE